MFQGDSSPRLGGAVACDDVFHRMGREGAGYERGGVRDDAVEDDWYPVDGAGQDHTDDSGVLESAYRRKNTERVFGVRRVQFQCLLHYINLELQGFVVDACATARGLLRRTPCKGGDETSCRRGVTYTHV